MAFSVTLQKFNGKNSRIIATLALMVCLSLPVTGDEAPDDGACEPRQYVFSWNLADKCLPEPRGGTTEGAPVTLATGPSAQWRALQKPGLSPFERDRRAILAMAGGYRASFEFLETIGFAVDYTPARPYQSWGTEYVYVVEDRRDFISLQHIMVMYFMRDGEGQGPMVMKHWRQDWQYQDREILEYAGNNTWRNRRLDEDTVRSTWSQSVYQVDDSPRYAAYGTWQHNDSFSAWESGETWRPLPRRESSVRNDYQVLEGTNRHVIVPTGWVQEEENRKRRLTETGDKAQGPYLAKELGNNRYQQLVDFDWSAGDDYWRETGPFWKLVRAEWTKLFERRQTFTLKKEHQGARLFTALFDLAEQFGNGELEDAEQAVATVIGNYVADQ